MKTLTTVLGILSLVATPAYASERHHRDRNDDDTGKVVAGVLGGLIVGLIIADSKKKDRDDRHYCNRRDHRYCDDDRYYTKSKKPKPQWRERCHDYNYRNRHGTWQTERVCD